jgi:hypothetical protein
MPKFVTEKRLVDVLRCHFAVLHATGREVPHYEKRIDLMAVNVQDGELWAIEAKVEAWPRALSQAIVNLTAAQRSFIAIYSEHAHRVNLDRLDLHGIGLIAVGKKWGDVKVLKEAKLSPFMNRLAIEQIRTEIVKRRRR